MFLSTENPPNDPLSSSSSFLFHLSSSSHDLAQSHLSNFSIRDYAYSNRKKNIKKNWPFSNKSLQLFSTHGVTDPLPPFQKFSTVTNQFENKTTSSPGKQIVSYVHQGRDLAKLVLNQSLIAAETTRNQSKNDLFTRTNQVSKSQVVATSKKNNNQNSSKKFGRGSKEDLVMTTTISDQSTMASKTCPICKTFSSASNTTLNAHIDQCLSVDSSAPLPQPPVSSSSSKPNKPRASKPRMKVKTMVDIYASAKGCTLEDLDRRNGTKWASILSYKNRVVVAAADKSEVSKKRKVSPVGVGPVYIDAKGQKLRILSEFSEKKASTSATLLREQREDGSSEKKSLSLMRIKRREKKHHKYVKLTNHKANVSEIPEHRRGLSGEGSSTGHRRIYNQRMLAKCGLVSKKLNAKEHKFYALRDQLSDDDDDDDDSWSEERDPTVLRGSSPLNKQKLRRTCGEGEVAGRNRSLFGSKRARKSLGSIQEDKYPPRKKLCSNAWRVSLPAGKVSASRENAEKARLDFSEKEDEEEEEAGRWESEMTQERELSDDDYVSGDNGETNEVLPRLNPSSSGYDEYDDKENSEEEEDINNKGANVLDETDDTGAEFYQSDSPHPSKQEMYYSKDVGDMIYEQTPLEEDVRFNTEVGQRSLFVEVDTIPIPGPPGSFLLSPRDMGFDENLGNSSVITSQVQSSMDQLDRNSSESPVSNFAAGRLNFPAELSSSFREHFSSEIPVSYSTTPMSFSAPSHHVKHTEDVEPITVDKTTPSRFRNNDHEPCCCQRKDGITLNHQASQLLQRRAASSSSSSIAMNLTKPPTCLDPNYPLEQSLYMIQQDLDLQRKSSCKTYLNSPVPPSPSNPVLRLMGKDLMVMNQGEAADGEEGSRSSLKPTPQFLEGSSYFNTGLYLRNSFESTHQPQPQASKAQVSAFRNNFDHVRFFSPS